MSCVLLAILCMLLPVAFMAATVIFDWPVNFSGKRFSEWILEYPRK